MILEALFLCQTVTVRPLPLEWVRERLATKKPKLGAYVVEIEAGDDNLVTSSVAVNRVIQQGAPSLRSVPVFLTKEEAWPIILRMNGRKWRIVRQILSYGGVAATAKLWAPGVGVLAILDVLRNDADKAIPDLSTLSMEMPSTISVSAKGGVHYLVWTPLIPNPTIIGPVPLN